MAKLLTLLLPFLIHVTMHSVNANGEGEYTTDLGIILAEMDDDPFVWNEGQDKSK